MIQPRLFSLLFGVVLTLGSSVLQAAETTEDLLARVSDTANVVVVVDVEGMFKSPLGTLQKWSQRYRTDYANGLVPFPPSVQRAVLATELNPETMHPSWELGVLQLNRASLMKELATREQTAIEKFDGRLMVTTAQRTYFVELKPQTVAIANYQNRQEMARWLRFAMANKQPTVSEYLRNAALDQTSTSQYRLAMDLQDIPHLDEVRFKLDHVKTPLPPTLDRDALAKTITGIRGMRVDVQMSDTIQGTVRLDFNDNLAPFAPVMSALALEVFARRGVDLPELHRAKSRVVGKSVIFENELSESSFRRVLSLIQPYSAAIEEDERASSSDAPRTESPQEIATKRYLRSVTTMFEDLEKQARYAKTYAASAHWFETSAKKIDQLTVREVDPEVLAYATGVSAKFRAMAQSLRGVPLDVKALEHQKKEEYNAVPGGYIATPYAPYGLASPLSIGGYPTWIEYKNNFSEVEAKQAQVIAEGAKDREKIWDLLQGETAAIRSKMTQKYGRNF